MRVVHVGKEIDKKLHERKMSIVEFAKQINKSRSSIYYMLSSNDINIKTLINVLKVLNYDFIGEFFYRRKHINLDNIMIVVPVETKRVGDVTEIILKLKDPEDL